MEDHSDNIQKEFDDKDKASLLLRTIARALDFIVAATAVKLIPQVGYFFGLIYLLISDGFFDGRSLGKKVMRIRVISLPAMDNCTFRQSILRNTTIAGAFLLYIIPIIGWLLAIMLLALEFILMLGNKDGMRLGDYMANTIVTEDIVQRPAKGDS